MKEVEANVTGSKQRLISRFPWLANQTERLSKIHGEYSNLLAIIVGSGTPAGRNRERHDADVSSDENYWSRIFRSALPGRLGPIIGILVNNSRRRERRHLFRSQLPRLNRIRGTRAKRILARINLSISHACPRLLFQCNIHVVRGGSTQTFSSIEIKPSLRVSRYNFSTRGICWRKLLSLCISLMPRKISKLDFWLRRIGKQIFELRRVNIAIDINNFILI